MYNNLTLTNQDDMFSINFYGGDYIVNEVDWGNPVVNFSKANKQVGTYTYFRQLAGRTITIKGYILGDTYADIETKRINLERTIAYNKVIRVQYGGYYIETYAADSVKFGTQFKDNNPSFKLFTIKLYADNPYFKVNLRALAVVSGENVKIRYPDPHSLTETEIGSMTFTGNNEFTFNIDNKGTVPDPDINIIASLYNSSYYTSYLGAISIENSDGQLMATIELPIRQRYERTTPIDIRLNAGIIQIRNNNLNLMQYADIYRPPLETKCGQGTNFRKFIFYCYDAMTGGSRVPMTFSQLNISGALEYGTV